MSPCSHNAVEKGRVLWYNLINDNEGGEYNENACLAWKWLRFRA